MLSVTFNISKSQQSFSDMRFSEWTALTAVITDYSSWLREKSYIEPEYWNFLGKTIDKTE